MTEVVGDAEFTDDVFLGGRATIRQPARGYRAGIDAVLLAAAAPAGNRALDVGAGVGAVGLCLAARSPGVRVTLIEREVALVTLARHNIIANGWSDRASALEIDVRAGAHSGDVVLAEESFDVVLANPPYGEDGTGTASQSALRASAHAMPAEALDGWLRFMARFAAPGGRAVIVHRADALLRLLSAFSPRFGALRILPIQPRVGEPANRVIVGGVKGSRGPLTLLAPLVVHDESKAFTARAAAILRDGAPLSLF